MAYLVPYLRSFNRKERFYLVGLALGNEHFRLDASFRNDLSSVLDLTIPKDAFVAMDYHLDWLFAAMHMAAHSGAAGPNPRDPGIIAGNQEDVDLLIAFDTSSEESHVVMVEAKGVTPYSNDQLTSKVRRMAASFSTPEAELVTPHFALVSPNPPQRLRQNYPSWMLNKKGKIPWLHLPLPDGLQKVTCCDDSGRPMYMGPCWTVVEERMTSK